MAELGLDLEELLEHEEEPGLGNGGLGRLAACYLDSLATLQIPAIGYGIRYEFGIFDQRIRDGWQVENTDKWLHAGNPWELSRPKISFTIKLGGQTEHYTDERGRYRARWIPETAVKGTAFDTPILGYGVNNVNLLRLWSAEAPESFDFQAFNIGDYYGAVGEKVRSENLTKVLYPNDEPLAGQRLRLEQQYFFVSCSLQDMIRIYLAVHDGDLSGFHEKYAVQLNDTHPAVAVPELMRLLVDDYDLDWDTAWDVTQRTFAYTNHTLLPEALETWPVETFQRILPRHLEIIYGINQRFLDEVRSTYPGDSARVQRMSLIDEAGNRSIRMAPLATVGSFSVNGVSAMHTALLKRSVLSDFHEFYPGKFNNKTNGVTPRRFMALANPGLTALITEQIGNGWLTDLERLRELEAVADDEGFQSRWRAVQQDCKLRMVDAFRDQLPAHIDTHSMFDTLVKRIHEYKRQHLAVLHILHLYRQLLDDPATAIAPRTFIFAGKAAPGYRMAKLIIKLINAVAAVVNDDPVAAGRLRVVFIPNYSVKVAERIYPAADLSEQISMAGKEASGTGNMKFSLNGALTIGTLDGANVEIREAVGAENFFQFGLTVEEVHTLQQSGYQPARYYERNPALAAALDMIDSGSFSGGDSHVFRPLVDSLKYHDPFCVMADFQSYLECQSRVSELWADPARWTRMAILNTARMGYFSSDRTIREYCSDIWRVQPEPVELVNIETG
jgi:starch phosphorylase